jgi:surfactin synthase thioesterase subunit
VENYAPAGKIAAPVHFFKAVQSWQLKWKRWHRYTSAPLQIYEISGDHFTLFKHLTDKFDQILHEMHHRAHTGEKINRDRKEK